ncbi:hypothetical protein PILCRDRAFT_13200 [Piloderma croceum F 1598]|uniref:CCHC-type domain-containing protein n=1 Tax=Piloderma croceum (strain F 1598) TaxID=765440 RepID=A0A0C3F7Z4_PILCF|nr:hypothetical protein PILCRDRAFT_13200 [Piloderma croceum F 1598]
MFITLLLITVLTILIYLLLITQPTFHRRSYRYLGDEIRGYEKPPHLLPHRPDLLLLVPLERPKIQPDYDYGIPIETSPLIEESRIINQQLVEQSVFYNTDESLPNIQRVSSPTPAIRTELDHLLQQTELESTHSSPLLIEITSPLLLLEFLCKDLVAEGDEFLHEKYQRVQTLLQFWNEKPVVGTLWTIGGGTTIGIFSEKETLNTEQPSDYHSPPLLNLNLSVPSKNHFDLEPLEELTLAKPLRTPTNPYLPEHADIQSEDISLGHATLNLHHMLASLMDLYQPLYPLLGPLAHPTPSALFQIQTPRTTAYALVAYTLHKSLHRLHSTTVSSRSRRGRYGISDDTDSNGSSEEERPFHSPEPPSIEEESPQEVPEELTSSTHPFYEGRQYPPVPPLEPPPQVHLPPPPALSTNPSMSNPPPAAPAAPAIGIFFLANPDIYDTDLHKIFFTLTLLNEGPPGQWAQNYVERVEAQADQAGNIPDAAWGTFNTFMNNLRDSFADPNKGRSASNALETLTYDDNLYNDAIPTTYPAYEERVIRFDNLEQWLKVTTHHSGPKRSYSSPSYSSSSNPSHAKTSTRVYGGAGEPMDIGRNRPKAKLWVPHTSSSTKKPAGNKPTGGAMRIKCFGCGKEGHMVSNCPLAKRKKQQQICAFIEELDDEETDLIKDFLKIFDTRDNCTYIATNEIDCLNRTKTALDQDDLERLRGPPPLEEEPKEPGTREARRHTLTTKATVLA